MNSRFTLAFCLFFAPLAVFAQCPIADITLSSQADVTAFPTNYPSCTQLTVKVTISGADITSLSGLSAITQTTKSIEIEANSLLTNLTGLGALTSIGGNLLISDNGDLTSLSGLGALSGSLGGYLYVNDNADLVNLSALGGVSSISGFVQITNNGSLASISGLNSVTSIGGYFSIASNNAITSINGFNNLTSIGGLFEVSDNGSLSTLNGLSNLATITGNCSFDNNSALTSISTLSDLTSIGGNLLLANNSILSSLTGLNNLTTITGSLLITNNDGLTTLDPSLDNLTTIGGSLLISLNNVLSNCAAEGICDFLEGPGDATIEINVNGCNSVAQVETACLAAPVEMTSFNVRQDSDGAMLTWQTATELNNDFFEVEHSLNGGKFQPIGYVAGNGTSQTVNNYHFLHRQPPVGMNYYRLKQVDLDGQFTHSNIVTLRLRSDEPDVFPNPTTGYVAISGKVSEGTARVTDFTGKLIREQNLEHGASFNLFDQPDGIYFIEIQTGNQKILRRVIKSKG